MPEATKAEVFKKEGNVALSIVKLYLRNEVDESLESFCKFLDDNKDIGQRFKVDTEKGKRNFRAGWRNTIDWAKKTIQGAKGT